MTNVVRIKPDKPLTVEQALTAAHEQLERELKALGIDLTDPDDSSGE